MVDVEYSRNAPDYNSVCAIREMEVDNPTIS